MGREADALSPWLQPELKALGVPAVCWETRHVRSALIAQRNKTDATDALRIAHVVRTGWFGAAHEKSGDAYLLRLLFTASPQPEAQVPRAGERGSTLAEAFGIRLNKVGRADFERAVREAVAGDQTTAELMDSMLAARAALWREDLKLHGLGRPAGRRSDRRRPGVRRVGRPTREATVGLAPEC